MTCSFLAKKKQVEIRLMKSTFNSHWDMIQGFFALHEQVLSTIDDGNLEKLRRKNYLLNSLLATRSGKYGTIADGRFTHGSRLY